MNIDFGSGRKPAPGYKTCDCFAARPDIAYDPAAYRIDVGAASADQIRCRNVLHHVRDLNRLFAEFRRVLKPGGFVLAIEPHRDAYPANVLLDRIWYRAVVPRPEIWFSERYRDYSGAAASAGFRVAATKRRQEKEITVFINPKQERKKMDSKVNEKVAEELEKHGYDYAVAVATNAEVEAGAACGQLAIITENEEEEKGE